MKIQRHTDAVLVVQNSTLWLSAVFGVIGLILLAAAFSAGNKRVAVPASVMAVCAVLCLSKYTFVFDSTQRMVRWQTLRFGKSRAGSMPFDEVKDVVLESAPSTSGRPTYRLAMLTAKGSIPLSSGYGDTSGRCLALQSQIMQLLRPWHAAGATAPAMSISVHLDSSIRTLVAQGRKADAIKLLISTGMNLTDAKQRADDIERQMQVS